MTDRDRELRSPMPESLRRMFRLPPRTAGDLETLDRRARYDAEFDRMRRDLMRQRALAADVTLRFGAGRDEHREAAQRGFDIDLEIQALIASHNAGAPLRVRAFPPLSGCARRLAPPPKPDLFQPAPAQSDRDGFEDILDAMG